jgi:hypothetical protein
VLARYLYSTGTAIVAALHDSHYYLVWFDKHFNDSGFGEPRSEGRPVTYRRLDRKRTAKMAVCCSTLYKTGFVSSRAEVSLYQAAYLPYLRRDPRVITNLPHDWFYSERPLMCRYATFQVAYIAV